MVELLEKIISRRDLTLNEISLLIEAGNGAFTREDLLKTGRLTEAELYSAAPLTRTIKKLLDKGLLTESDDAKHRKIYSLNGVQIPDEFKSVLVQIGRSRACTLNTIRVSAFLLYQKNLLSSARYIANGLEMDLEYLVNTVLPRMCVLNLLTRKELTRDNDMHMESEDLEIVESDNARKLMGFSLNTDWKANIEERWI